MLFNVAYLVYPPDLIDCSIDTFGWVRTRSCSCLRIEVNTGSNLCDDTTILVWCTQIPCLASVFSLNPNLRIGLSGVARVASTASHDHQDDKNNNNHKHSRGHDKHNESNERRDWIFSRLWNRDFFAISHLFFFFLFWAGFWQRFFLEFWGWWVFTAKTLTTAEVIPDLTTISASEVIGDMMVDPAAIVTCPTDWGNVNLLHSERWSLLKNRTQFQDGEKYGSNLCLRYKQH